MRFMVVLHFDCENLEDAQDHVEGLENHLETFEPPTWVHNGPLPLSVRNQKGCPPCGRGNHEWCQVQGCGCRVIHPGHAQRRAMQSEGKL